MSNSQFYKVVLGSDRRNLSHVESSLKHHIVKECSEMFLHHSKCFTTNWCFSNQRLHRTTDCVCLPSAAYKLCEHLQTMKEEQRACYRFSSNSYFICHAMSFIRKCKSAKEKKGKSKINTYISSLNSFFDLYFYFFNSLESTA